MYRPLIRRAFWGVIAVHKLLLFSTTTGVGRVSVTKSGDKWMSPASA